MFNIQPPSLEVLNNRIDADINLSDEKKEKKKLKAKEHVSKTIRVEENLTIGQTLINDNIEQTSRVMIRIILIQYELELFY